MLDEGEWRWVEQCAQGNYDHLLLALSDPFLLAEGVHGLQGWNEAICDGAWGARAARLGERMRQALDLDHWASFEQSFRRLTDLIEGVGAGRAGRPPATIVVLSGDVHNAYVVEAAFPAGADVRSSVYQLVCSPFRNPLDRRDRIAERFAAGRTAGVLGRALAAAAGVARPRLRWLSRRTLVRQPARSPRDERSAKHRPTRAGGPATGRTAAARTALRAPRRLGTRDRRAPVAARIVAQTGPVQRHSRPMARMSSGRPRTPASRPGTP